VKIGFHSHIDDEEGMKDYFLWITVPFEAITLTFKLKKREKIKKTNNQPLYLVFKNYFLK